MTVKRSDGRERVFHPNHVVFAVGFGGGLPNMPTFPGTKDFEGQLMHSSKYDKATDHPGKKVVVIGSCTSGKQKYFSVTTFQL